MTSWEWMYKRPRCFAARGWSTGFSGLIQPYLPFHSTISPVVFSEDSRVRGKSGPVGLLVFVLPLFFPLPLPLPFPLVACTRFASLQDMSSNVFSSAMAPPTDEVAPKSTTEPFERNSLAPRISCPGDAAASAASGNAGGGPAGVRTPIVIWISRFTARNHICNATSRPNAFRRRKKSQATHGGESNLLLEPTACAGVEVEQLFHASPCVAMRSAACNGAAPLIMTTSSPCATPSTCGFAPAAPNATEEKQAFGTSETMSRSCVSSFMDKPSQPAGSRT
mmetsp:Transcript_82532/g.238474  ORF Transcript_82532/g.238474 Transcript_82532/m.238474 type:complete len:279 (-) Transcript_82532:152-988(-)